MKEKRKRWADKHHEKEEAKNYGENTIFCKNMDHFKKIINEFNGQMVSPGGAAGMLHVSRAYIHQIEKEGRIRVYRVWDEDLEWKELPLWVRVLTPKRSQYIMIPIEDIEKIKKERIEKAKETIKKLKG